MAKKPLRLYRKLKPTAPIFEFTYGSTVLTDDVIRSITIHRGGDGVTPSTAEVATVAFASVASGENCMVQLSTYGASLVAGLTSANANVIKPRFSGRIGKQYVDDTGKKQTTTFLAASLSAQHPALKKGYTFTKGSFVNILLRAIMTPAAVSSPTVSFSDVNEAYGRVWTAITEPASYSDLVGRFTTDLGIIARALRSGAVHLMTHNIRNSRAIANLSIVVPLARSQALSPARWEQNNETRPRNYRLKYINAAGTLVEELYGDTSDTLAEVVELDMSHVQFNDVTQPQQEAFARRAREWLTAYAVPSVTVDLLYLISSPNTFHKMQAAKLLAMEVNDPVHFSGDWHPNLRGIHYAEEITETITPTSWELELKLLPSQEVTGYSSPDIPARVWDQATYAWNAETRTWNNA